MTVRLLLVHDFVTWADIYRKMSPGKILNYTDGAGLLADWLNGEAQEISDGCSATAHQQLFTVIHSSDDIRFPEASRTGWGKLRCADPNASSVHVPPRQSPSNRPYSPNCMHTFHYVLHVTLPPLNTPKTDGALYWWTFNSGGCSNRIFFDSVLINWNWFTCSTGKNKCCTADAQKNTTFNWSFRVAVCIFFWQCISFGWISHFVSLRPYTQN